MAIVRTNRQFGFTLIDNQAIGNKALSWAAEGLLHYLLSKPDGWTVNPSHLWQEKKGVRGCGRDAVYKLLNELIEVGFIHRFQLRDAKGATEGFDYYVYDAPQPPPENQEMEQPQAPQGVEPNPENQDVDEQSYPENPYPENQDISKYGSRSNTDLSSLGDEQKLDDAPPPQNPHGNAILDNRPPAAQPSPQVGMFPMSLDWKPGEDFAGVAHLSGLIDAEFLPEQLNEFRIYWQPTGRVYFHSQWQQKFIQSLKHQKSRGQRYEQPGRAEANNGGGNATDRFQQGLAAIQAVQEKYGYGGRTGGDSGDCFDGDFAHVSDPLAGMGESNEYGGTGGGIWDGANAGSGAGGYQP
ncbi:DnaT-like ssDNA-binding domain-containing protein [Chania multitudinisentens]|uniref:DnaT-like ssDNA-binding domain-containing protein n=1 Tax=Chania multitudinisentens TaxID=1639108 RepID=UPI0003E12F06|nr:DnaT-like ssDNA-binding domain-containing protein [Chania multitudinisentens]